MRTRRTRREILADTPPLAHWPAPSAEQLPAQARLRFESNCLAVRLWAEERPEDELIRKTGLTARDARQLVLRCCMTNPLTGKLYGFWACMPDFKAGQGAQRTRRAPLPSGVATSAGLSGALEDTLRRYPRIRQGMEALLFRRTVKGDVKAPLVTPKLLHDTLLKVARSESLHVRNEWPFCTKDKGREAVRKWMHRNAHLRPVLASDALAGPQARVRSAIAFGVASTGRPLEPPLAYKRVELDEKVSDALAAIAVMGRDGALRRVGETRVTVLAIIETTTTAVLACAVAYGAVTSNDIKRLIRRAIVPPHRFELPFENESFRYLDGAAYPAQIAELSHNVWQELGMDQAASHLSDETLVAIEQVVGCVIDASRPANPIARPYIENFFNRLARFEAELPTATGNTPVSPIRRDPQAAAWEVGLYAPLVEVLLDVECRNHNVRPNRACDGLSPLDALRSRLMRGELYRANLEELRPDTLWKLLPAYPAQLQRVKVAGGIGPFYVQWKGARYTSDELKNSAVLAGLDDWRVMLYVDDDARFARVVPLARPDLSFPVAVMGRYADTPHTLEWRQHLIQFTEHRVDAERALAGTVAMGVMEGLADAARTDEAARRLLVYTQGFARDIESGRAEPVAAPRKTLVQTTRPVAQFEFVDVDEPDASSVPTPAESKPASDEAPDESPYGAGFLL